MIRISLLALAAMTLGAQTIEETELQQLIKLKRVFVDRLTGGETAAQMRDIIIASLESSKLFVLTENEEKADAILRGAAEDLVYTKQALHVGGSEFTPERGHSAQRLRIAVGFRGHGLRRQRIGTFNRAGHEAIASVRLVNKDGDVIWSTTQ